MTATMTKNGEPAVELDAATLPSAYLLTWKDWRKLPEREGCYYEILGGELYMSGSPTTLHERVSENLMFVIEAYLRRTGLGELFNSRTAVRLSPRDVVQPDILVVLAEHAALIGEEKIEGAPDLVVEVLSPGTARRDLGVKRALYERGGVGEYWIFDPIGEQVQVYVLVDEAFRSGGSFGRHDLLHSALLPGLEIALDEVFPKR
jgi:Uma2 family endonuclease